MLTNKQYLKRHYKLPFLKVGLKVIAQGLTGKVVSLCRKTKTIGIRFKHDPVDRICYYHPKWQIKYYDNRGNLLAEFKD